MFSKKNIIKGLVLLNTGTVLAKIIGKISSAKADEEILTFAINLTKTNTLFYVPNWLIYLTIICAILCSYLTAKEKVIKGGKR